jgi:predicted nucleotidyltransferase
MMEAYDWVPERGSANLLGRDVRSMATSSTHEHLEQFFNEEIVNRSLRELVRESCENSGQFKEHQARLLAFIDGCRSQ